MTICDFVTKFILPHENVYKKGNYGDPNFVISECVKGDAGGLTKYGIDAASHPGIDIENLTEDLAISLYIGEYLAIHWAIAESCPALPQFPPTCAFAFFDCRENCGLTAAWKCLQRALGIEADGIPGEITRKSVLQATSSYLMSKMIDEREAYHRLVAQNNPQDRQFLEGWLDRCNDLRNFLGKAT